MRSPVFRSSRSVGINQSSPQAKGLVFWSPLSEPSAIERVHGVSPVVGDKTLRATDGRFGRVVDFDRSAGQNISFTHSNLGGKLDFGTAPFAMSCWIKVASFTNPFEYFFTKNYGGASVKWFGLIYSDSIGFYLEAYWDNGTDNAAISTNKQLDDGLWHFVAMSRDGTTRFVYVDDEVFSSGGLATNDISNTGDLILGERADLNSARRFGGQMVDARLYNRHITPEEALAMYHNPFDLYQKPRFVIGLPPSGLTLTKQADETSNLDSGLLNLMQLNRYKANTVNVDSGLLNLMGLTRAKANTVNVDSGQLALSGLLKVFSDVVNVATSVLTSSGLVKLTNETIYLICNRGGVDAYDSDMLAWWDFEDNGDLGVDSSVTGNDLTDGGGVSQATPGAISPAGVTSDASDSSGLYILDANHTGLDLSADFTISGWIYPRPTLGSNETFLIVDKVASTATNTDRSYYLIVQCSTTNGRAYGYIDIGGAIHTVSSSFGTVDLNAWNHVVLTYADPGPNGTLTLYLNGTQEDQKTITLGGNVTNSTQTIKVGGRLYSSDTLTDFDLDQVFILGRVLNSSEVLEVYQSGGLYLLSMFRPIADTINIVTDLIRKGVFLRFIAETVNIVSVALSLFTLTKVIDDVVNIASGAVTYFAGQLLKIADEVMYLLEEIVYENSLIQAIAETVNISEAKEKYLGSIKAIAETVNIDHAQEYFDFFLEIINEIVNIDHDLDLAGVWVRFKDEVVNIVENTIGGGDLLKIWNELVFIQNVETGLQEFVKWINETVNIQTATARATGLYQIIAEVVNIQTVKLTKGDLVQLVSDVVQLVDAQLRALSFKRQIAEYVRINEANLTPKQLGRIIENQVSIIEDVLSWTTLSRIVDEVINITHTRFLVNGFVRTASETVNVVESLITRVYLIAMIAEYVQIDDVIGDSQSLVKIKEELVRVYDNLNRSFSYSRLITEQVQINSQIIFWASLTRLVDEVINIVEAPARFIALIRTIAEQVQINSVTAYLGNLTRQALDVVQIGTTSATTRGLNRAQSDIVRIYDRVEHPFNFGRIVGDTINVIESAALVKAISQVVNMVVQIRETIADAVPVLYTLKNLSLTAIKFVTPRKSASVYIGRKAIKVLSERKGLKIE